MTVSLPEFVEVGDGVIVLVAVPVGCKGYTVSDTLGSVYHLHATGFSTHTDHNRKVHKLPVGFEFSAWGTTVGFTGQYTVTCDVARAIYAYHYRGDEQFVDQLVQMNGAAELDWSNWLPPTTESILELLR